MTRQHAIFLLSILLLIGGSDLRAHDTGVHQYVSQEGYLFLESSIGAIPELRDRIGFGYSGGGPDSDPWSTGLVGVGAWREDLEDPIWGYGGLFQGWTPTSTHFWNADDGDDVMTPIPGSPDAYNAYYKARVYLFGGHRIFFAKTSFDADIGQIILGRFYSYNSLVEFYKTGRCYSEGYIDLAGYVHLWSPSEVYMVLETARRRSAMILGRVVHLLTDQSVPAHTHNDLHPSGDWYEDFMGAHYLDSWYEPPYLDPTRWDHINAARQGGIIDPFVAVTSGDALREIRYLF